MGRLTGKIAIVTGAASGIGAASAKLFADEGAQVLAVDRPESAIEQAHAGNNAIAAFACDITGDEAPRQIVAAALAGSAPSTSCSTMPASAAAPSSRR